MSVQFGASTPTPPVPRSLTPADPAPANGTSTLQAASPSDPYADDSTRRFLHALTHCLDGEVDATRGTRARYSTDAGLYRIPPLAVAFPTSHDDVLRALDLARKFRIPVTNRGGGTSCSGNAIGPGLVMDYTRHMNKVLSIDPQARTAVVEPGCIEATLQAAAASFGLRFGPDPSSQNRATLAGMVANNACGPHATAWGRTADNIVSLECVDGLGRRFTARREHEANVPEVPGLAELIDANLGIIRTELGTFGRQVSGYSLEHLAPENKRNLAAMLVGTEGTLVTILEITVRLVPIPDSPALLVLGYPDMIAAADDVPTVLKHHPLAVEGLDSRLLEVVRRHNGPGAIPDLPEGNGWLMCEIGGEGSKDSLERARALAACAHTDAIGIYPPGDDAARLWRIRADGAGLGGRTPYDPASGKGNEQGWPGFEDAAVPPNNLGAYLREFTALMRQFNIDGLLYGHFGDGCVHIRLDMPLDTDEGVAHSRRFLEQAALCCASFGGSVSGEHGDGRARSELLRAMYSPKMLDLFAQVKAIFDPNNTLNPGVLTAPMPPEQARERATARAMRTHKAVHCGAAETTVSDATSESTTPSGELDPQPGVDLLDHFLRRPASQRLLADGGFAFGEDHGDFTNAIHRCTGVGKCRASIPATFMCPSWKATKDEKHVTRGRARTLQEAANGALVASLNSPEVLEALDLCLACKACSTDCPAGVDMAKYRSEVLYRRYRGKRRPLSHYALGMLPRWTRLSAKIPGFAGLANALMTVAPVRRLVFSTIGLDTRRAMPSLKSGTFSAWARKRYASPSDAVASGPRDPHGRRYVLAWADSFSQTLDDRGARSLVELLESNGFSVIVAPPVCCGLTWITTGQLPGAKKRLGRLLDAFAPFAVNGIPIVGVEPSCTAVLRDDLLDLLPEDPRSRAVSRATVTLAELLESVDETDRNLPDLHGVEVVAQPHCHHYSVMGWGADRALLTGLGAKVIELSGCCGLAGNFGMEKGHYDMSVAVAKQSLLPALDAHPDALYLADGFSCRTQATQLKGRHGIHLATLLTTHPQATTQPKKP